MNRSSALSLLNHVPHFDQPPHKPISLRLRSFRVSLRHVFSALVFRSSFLRKIEPSFQLPFHPVEHYGRAILVEDMLMTNFHET